MAQDMSGSPNPVALIADPFAKQFAFASQMGYINTAVSVPFAKGITADAPCNPIDIFTPGDPQLGVAIIILNSLPTPLTLVDSMSFDGTQVGYPAASKGSKPHQIPGARPYPRKSRHKIASGARALMGGVGRYQYHASGTVQWGGVAQALSFKYSDDPSAPLIGVAMKIFWGDGSDPHSAVTAELPNSDLASFFSNTVITKPIQFHSGSSNNITVWGTFDGKTNPRPLSNNDSRVLTVWVRDVGSTLGF